MSPYTELVIERVRQGEVYRTIAADLGISITTVGEIANAAGLRRHTRLGRSQQEEIVRRAESGERYAMIAADFGCCPTRVGQLAIAAGINRGQSTAPKGNNSHGWRGGRSRSNGYESVYAPDHHRAIGKYVPKHVLVVEAAMGKPLRPTAPVHHVNQIKTDNRNCNLVACNDQAYHALLHMRMRALDACGDPNWLRCGLCKQYDAPQNIYLLPGKTSGGRHAECIARYNRELLRRNSC